MAIRNYVKEYRKKRKLTQVQLAEMVGVSRQSIYSIEKSKSEPSLELAFKLSTVLDSRIDKLFQVIDSNKPNDSSEIAPFSLF